MSQNEIKPVAWRYKDYNPLLNGGFAYGYTHDPEIHVRDEPLYDQSAIDRLTAERDDALAAADFLEVEMAKFQIAADTAKAERDDALAAADSKAGWEWKKRAEKAEAERDAAVAERDNMRSAIAALMAISPYGK